jgi:hypothetical protein
LQNIFILGEEIGAVFISDFKNCAKMRDRLNSDIIVPQLVDFTVTTTACGTDGFFPVLV